MTNNFKIFLIVFVLFTACKDRTKDIFWISEPNGQENDLLFLAESTNVPVINMDSLVNYLTEEELLIKEDFTFKDFGTVYQNEKFDVLILLRERINFERDYIFIVRTFNKKREVIDSCELAKWVDSENLHCYGSIDKNLVIKQNCKDGNNNVRQILEDGRITITSFR